MLSLCLVPEYCDSWAREGFEVSKGLVAYCTLHPAIPCTRWHALVRVVTNCHEW